MDGDEGQVWRRWINGRGSVEIGMTSREEYGNGGRPDDIGIDGDGIGSGGDGISRCRSGEPVGDGCLAGVPQPDETFMVGPRIEPVVHSTI
jgi:hypothetical protein